MKKQLNKLKKRLSKKLDSLKEHLKAQAFYAREAFNSAKNLSVQTIKACLLVTLILFTSLSAGFLHESYIESSVGKNVVFITNPDGAKVQGSATGFEVKAPSGRIYTLTNAHVCELQKDGFVLLGEKQHSQRLVPRRVLEVYQENDLCLVEGLEGYSGLDLADSISTGQRGWAVGYPLGQGMNISTGRVKGFANVNILDAADKECNAPNKHKEKFRVFIFEIEACIVTRFSAQTDVPTYPGNSGSPLVNKYGNVIGVMFAAQSETAWGSAVPLKDVKKFLSAY